MNIQKEFLTINKFSRPSTKRSKTTKVAVHYVGNAGSSAMANRNYFENLKNQTGTKTSYASSHYIIGLQGEIIYCVPEDEIAYTTNSANAYSIGIEVCHPKSDGIFTDVTRKALIELVADICKRYKLSPDTDIIRHFDVTQKSCPMCWASNSGAKYQDYLKFKSEVKDFMSPQAISKVKINLFGVQKTIDSINKENTNYVKLRDLDCEKLKVGYNGNPTVNGKIVKLDKENSILLNGNNYVKIRVLEGLGFMVGYDAKIKVIEIK